MPPVKKEFSFAQIQIDRLKCAANFSIIDTLLNIVQKVCNKL